MANNNGKSDTILQLHISYCIEFDISIFDIDEEKE